MKHPLCAILNAGNITHDTSFSLPCRDPGRDLIMLALLQIIVKLGDLRSHTTVENGARILNPMLALSICTF